ncbi:MAG: PAS domain-containing protein [Pyrinomonadaceae bacterium]
MEAQLEHTAEEIKRLRRCINDMNGVIALPDIWSGGGPAVIVRTLLDVLLDMLRLDLVYVRSDVGSGDAPIEMARVARPRSTGAAPREFGELFRRRLGDDSQDWPPLARITDEDGEMTVVPMRLGLQGEIGVIVAGSRRADFPRQTERLVLSVAANQAAIGLQQARLLSEQTRVADELDERVAQRTSELAAANQALKKEVAERKRAEEALRRNENDSRMIVDSIPGLVAVFSPGGEVEFVNRQVFEYFGGTLEEHQRWAAGGTTHPEDLPRVVESFNQAIASGEPFELETRALRSDGVYRWVQSRGAPLRDADGQIARWYNLLIDIDERKRAEEALAASERKLKLTIDTIPALAWSARPDGSAEFFNQHYLEYVGLSTEQAGGWGWTAAVHPDDSNSLSATWQRILASGAPGEAEARLRRHDGEYRWFLFRASPLRDELGKIVKWYGTNTDIDDRKRAEAQRDRTIEALQAQQAMLRESEQRFRAIFDEAGAGITLVDLQRPGTPIQNNRALQTMLRVTQEELGVFETYDELTAGEDRETDAAAFRELCEGRRDSLRREKHFVLRDGGSAWANVIFTLLRDSAGLPRFIIAIHEDITGRKRAVERLQAKQELLDLAQKSARAMAFDWYVQQDVNVWSPEQEALYGMPPGSFDGTYRGWKKLIYPPDWPLLLKAIEHAHETGEVAVEFRVKWPDGSLHWLSTNGQMFFDEQGKPFRMVGFTSDVTPRKLAEEELRRSEAFLAEAQRLSSTGSFSWRPSTNAVIWSGEVYRIFEFDQGVTLTHDLIGTRIHPDDFMMWAEAVNRTREGGGFELDYRLLMPDGRVKHLHALAHAARDGAGELEYIGAVQDVTAQRVSEEALGRLRSELAHVSKVATLGALTASIAHEVNQPLSGIITNASTCLRMLAADPPNVDGARETARRTIRDGHRASDVVTRLRALFGKQGATTEPVDLNEATREVIALSLSELRRNRVIPRLELADDLPPVKGDRVQLQQVIMNLLLNALDAMSGVEDCPTPLVIRTARDEDDRVRLSVRDAGVGFDPQAADRLFQPFYTTKDDGMGIGLSVSRSIIESHHGRLWATLNEGPGATLSFSLPQASEAATGVDEVPATAAPDAERDGGDS